MTTEHCLRIVDEINHSILHPSEDGRVRPLTSSRKPFEHFLHAFNYCESIEAFVTISYICGILFC